MTLMARSGADGGNATSLEDNPGQSFLVQPSLLSLTILIGGTMSGISRIELMQKLARQDPRPTEVPSAPM